MELKDASAMRVKSSGVSPYVANRLGGGATNFWLSPSLAMWLWEVSDTVFDATDRICTAFMQLTPALFDKKTKEFISSPDDHPFLKLLENPSMQQTADQFMYELCRDFLVTSNCFPTAIGNVKFEPIGLLTNRAAEASLTVGNDGYLQNISFNSNEDPNLYERVTDPKRKEWIYQADTKLSETVQILNSRRRFGVEAQSPLNRVYYQATTKLYGNIHNSGIMKNASRPGGLWSPAKESMTQNQYESFKKEVHSNFSGSNTGRDIVSPIGVKYENFLLNPRDMDFINLIENSREEIYNIYHIPLALVSQKSMTMNNLGNSQTGFYDSAVLPTAKFLLRALGKFLLPRYKDGDRYELTFDEKQIPALKERLFNRAESMRKTGLYTENEMRFETGYAKIDDGETVYKPMNLIPAGSEQDFDPNDKEPIEPKEEEDDANI